MNRHFGIASCAVLFLLLAARPAESQTTWFKYEGNPVLTGGSGSWDEAVVSPGSVLRIDSVYQMWYGGFNTSYSGRIGYASSPDGITWTKHEANPLISPTYSWEGIIAFTPSVLIDGSKYKMWYTGNSNVGYATSLDGKSSWAKRSTPVLSPGSGWDGVAANHPCVLDTIGGFKMWYSGFRGNELAMIGYASGATETTWTKYPDAVLGPGGLGVVGWP